MSYDSTLKNSKGQQINPRTRAGCTYLSDEVTTVEDRLRSIGNGGSIIYRNGTDRLAVALLDSASSELSENLITNKAITIKLKELSAVCQ